MGSRVHALLLAALLTAGAAAAVSAGPAVSVTSPRPARLAAFYRDVLGLRPVAADSAGRRFVFDAAGIQVVVAPGRGGDAAGAVRLFLAVSDLEAEAGRLRGLGVTVREARDGGGVLRALLFADPEGNPLGFVPAGEADRAWLRPWSAVRGPGEHDRSGRVGLMVYGGLYGIWLGAAVPAGLGSRDASVIGGSVLAGGPLGVLAAARFASGRDVGRGRAGAMTLAGNFGTGQGIGWSLVNDADGRDAVLAGAVAGLTALVAAGLITERVEVSEGQAAVLHGSAYWGAWYGLVGARMAEASGEASGTAMLVSSAAGLALGSLWAAPGRDVGPTRAVLINLGGVLGTAAGFGFDLLFRVDDEAGVFAVAGAGGLAGLGAAALWTRGMPPPGRAAGTGPSFPGTLAPAPGGVRMTLFRAVF